MTSSTEASPSPKLSRLEELPWIALDSICAYLSPRQAIRPDLAAFSLTSSRCAAAAAKYRLKRIHLRLTVKKKLLEDLDHLYRIYFPFVRQIKLTGYIAGEGEARPYDGSEQSDRPVLRRSMKFNTFQFLPSKREKKELEDAWLPLARFIGSLGHLADADHLTNIVYPTDLVYSCPHQVPACLLSALQQNSPKTRLHVHTFSLRSLYQLRDHLHDIDPDEYALVTSPCLYSIVVRFRRVDCWGHVGYNEEAVRRMVTGLAPRLRSLVMIDDSPGDGLDRRPPWTGFHGEGPNTPTYSKGQIETLVRHRGRDIDTWSDYTDFNELRTLESHDVSLETLQALTRIALSTGFRSLRSLSISLELYPWNEARDVDEAAGALLRALNPLQALTLRGIRFEDSIRAVLDHHSKSLRQLRLEPALESVMDEDLRARSQHLVRECPHLEEVEIMMDAVMSSSCRSAE